MKIHFIGICGVAMSALATAFKNNGWEVTGSDVGFFPPVSDFLRENNIKFYPGWHPEKMIENGMPDLIVVGNVAGSTNPEFIFAQEHKLNYRSYPEVVAEYIVQKNSLVCAGTYGKTSTAALLTLILQNAGVDPSYMFGGLNFNLTYSAKIKGQTESWSVLEGDEYKTARWDSRPKFALYSPTHLLLTSVSWDHADIYPTKESYIQVFQELVNKIPSNGLIVACTDGATIDKIVSSNQNGTKIVSYGKQKKNNYSYHGIKQTKNGLSFVIVHNDTEYAITSPILGEHMAENICGVFAIAKEIGIEVEVIIKSIAEFKGIKRRLEKKYDQDIVVYDDLAHSPAKAKASLKTLRAVYPHSKIFAIFEPNTGNRKLQSVPGYAHAFASADIVIIPTLTKVKIDPNDPEPPFDGRFLRDTIAKTHDNAILIENDNELIHYLHSKTKKEDVVVFLGSHGFRGMIEILITSLRR